MLAFTHALAGTEVSIYVPQSKADLAGFERFLSQGDKVLGLDTETTGLDIYAPGFACRTVQLGNEREAWVLRTDLFAGEIRRALRQHRHFTLHNAPFDLQVIDRTLGVKIEELAPRVFDTYILAHLLDPRKRHEGGTGLRLKELAEIYVDGDAPDAEKDLHAIFRKEYKATKETGWALIDIDHPVYLRYAGLDPVLAVRLFRELAPQIRDLGLDHLSSFEHHFMALLALMQRKGVRVDVPYTRALKDRLLEESEHFEKVAARYGVGNVNSTAQVAEALSAMGETLTKKTDSGALSTAKEVLMPLADLDKEWERIGAREPNPLADAVMRAKRAEKWAVAYAQAFLDLKDADDRLHPVIGGLQARTARMSVSAPPLQQLPSGDWTIRRALVADPGHLIIAADYAQVEMRVLAALADEPEMKAAILSGTDLHDYTARLVYGDGFTKFQRKLMKGVGFGKVYGGGAASLAEQTGAPFDAVKVAVAEYDRVFPGIRAFGQRLQRQAEYGKREVVTPSGRHLPLDRDRLYSATNYVVQSTARDLLANAIVAIFDAGMGDYLLLPVHDEIVAQAPAGEAEEVIAEIGRLMESDFMGVPITSDPEVYGPSWGHGYGANDATHNPHVHIGTEVL